MPGPISDRLRALFGADVGAWPAWREPEEIHDMPEEDYQGIELGTDPGRGQVAA